MKLIATLTVTVLLAFSNIGFVNAQEAQQESSKEQIENTNQPQACRPSC